jgi:hypothetical protein
MVGRDNAHDVNVLSIKDLAVVNVQIGFAFSHLGIAFRLFGMTAIDIADGYNVAEASVFAGVTHTHTADADAADTWAVVF